MFVKYKKCYQTAKHWHTDDKTFSKAKIIYPQEPYQKQQQALIDLHYGPSEYDRVLLLDFKPD